MGKLNTYISSNQAWSMNEQLFLSQNYFKLPLSELSLKLNRSQGSITAKASDMGLNVNSMKKSKPAVYTVQKHIPVAPTPARESKIVDSPNLVKKARTVWTEAEEQFLIDNSKMSNKKLAIHLNKKETVIKDKKYYMKRHGTSTKFPVTKFPVTEFPVIAHIPELKDEAQVSTETQASDVEINKTPTGKVGEFYTGNFIPLEPVVVDNKIHGLHKIKINPSIKSQQVLAVGIDFITVKQLTLLTNYLDSLGIEYTIKSE